MTLTSSSSPFGASSPPSFLLQQITRHLRQSLHLPEILQAAVSETRQLLACDRVLIYGFRPDGSGEVLAESLQGSGLSALLGLRFPADDIPVKMRNLYLAQGLRSIVDVDSGLIGFSQQSDRAPEIEYRASDPCHLRYLKALGVKASVVVPICHRNLTESEPTDELWGLLIAHHRTSRPINGTELESLVWIAEQLGMAIAQATLFANTSEQARREATVNRIAALLHSHSEIELQQALEATVTALQGSGGRLYLVPQEANQTPQVYTCGLSLRSKTPLEASPLWEQMFTTSSLVIDNLYQEVIFAPFAASFSETPIRSLLIFPLYYRQKYLGSLTIFRNEVEIRTCWAGRFNPSQQQLEPRQSFEAWCETKTSQIQEWKLEERALGEALSNHFAAAIQQYQLYQQIKALNQTLEAQVTERTAQLEQALDVQQSIAEITDRIRSSLDLNDTLQALVQAVQDLLDCDRVVIYQFNQKEGGHIVIEERKEQWPSLLGLFEPQTYFSEYLNPKNKIKVRAINDTQVANIPPAYKKFLQHFNIQANLIVPIGVETELWGLLIAHQCQSPRLWSEKEINILQQLSDRAAIAIHKAELYQQSQLAAEREKTLSRVIRKIRESLDLATIFQTTTREILKILQVDRASVFRFNAEEGYDSGEFIAEEISPPFISIKGEKYNLGHQLFSGSSCLRIQVINDIYAETSEPEILQFCQQFQIRAILMVPLLSGDSVWGLLCLHQCEKFRQWENTDIEFVQQIASQLSVAIQQGSLLAQTQGQKEELARTLQELKQTQTHLIQTEKMSSLGQLVAGVAHEINNPVNFLYGNLNHLDEYAHSILSLLDLYQLFYPEPKPEIVEVIEEIELDFIKDDFKKMVKSMQMGAERIRQLVHSLKNFSYQDQVQKRLANIHEGLDSTILILQPRLKPKGHYLGVNVIKDYGDLPLVECYPGQLNQVFMNIISNALDAIEEQSHTIAGQITIRTREILANQVPSLLITIEDNGPGIPEEVYQSIFDPFFTTKPIGKGTGLGLAISYQIIVEKHGGTLYCYSQPEQGTRFEITIPLRPGEESPKPKLRDL